MSKDSFDYNEPLNFEEEKKKYFKTPKGKEAVSKYRHSEKGKAAIEKYTKSPKQKQAQRKYYYSPKGQAAHKRRQDKRDMVREAELWIKAHPGSTINDYCTYLKTQEV